MKQFILAVTVLLLLTSCSQKKVSEKNVIFVSLLPQKYFVEKIAGDNFKVEVMVRPGHSPATYEVLPRQMAALSDALIYFRIGVPFEDSWMDRISAANPEMSVVDTREGITLRSFETFEDEHHEDEHHEDEHHEDEHHEDEHHADEHDHDHSGKDPHIWLSPSFVKIQTKTMFEEISRLDPKNKEQYRKNLDEFHAELDAVSKEIHSVLEKLETRKFMVYHPAFGYFADDFNLRQIPIEIEGKNPSPKALRQIIDRARDENITVIFVQKQFSTDSAEAVAEEIGGSVIQIDPLDEDYLSNLKRIASTIAENI